MITSDGGLCEIPHIPAPAGLKELHNAIAVWHIPEICDIPFAFIPGVKAVSVALENADFMRGEETEFMGLDIDISGSLVLLPGSHSKCISVSKDGKNRKISHLFNRRNDICGEQRYYFKQNG